MYRTAIYSGMNADFYVENVVSTETVQKMDQRRENGLSGEDGGAAADE